MGKFCYLGDMVSCYGGASEAVSARIGSAWNKSRELSGVLVWRQGLSLKQRGKVYQCFFRPVLLYCSETWELTVATEARLRGVGRRMIRRNGGSKSKQKLLTLSAGKIGLKRMFFVVIVVPTINRHREMSPNPEALGANT